MEISFAGYGEKVATFKVAAKIDEGTFVKMNGNGTVAACTGEEEIAGVIVSSSDSYAAVQLGGVVTAPVATGVNGMAAGYRVLSAVGKNLVINDDDCSIKRLVLACENGKATFIL
ncbi:MAG: hypothetical protein K6B52_09550 [Clostridiales bacterium]|nr:hypothetical protein [Clostridiales bacterium]